MYMCIVLQVYRSFKILEIYFTLRASKSEIGSNSQFEFQSNSPHIHQFILHEYLKGSCSLKFLVSVFIDTIKCQGNFREIIAADVHD